MKMIQSIQEVLLDAFKKNKSLAFQPEVCIKIAMPKQQLCSHVIGRNQLQRLNEFLLLGYRGVNMINLIHTFISFKPRKSNHLTVNVLWHLEMI